MADIFDKMAAGINKGIAAVGANSKAMVEKAKINTIIKNLENEKKQLAELLGMKVYTAFAEGNEASKDEVESFCNEITRRTELIAAQHEELRRIELEASMVTGSGKANTAACRCGNVNTEGSKFCSKCGSPLS